VFGFGPATRIYLATGATDMRKGFEGLYGLVRDRLSSKNRETASYLTYWCRRSALVTRPISRDSPQRRTANPRKYRAGGPSFSTAFS
jgi:hypothetical protein